MSDGITICSVGDLMICDSPLYASVGVGSKYKNKTTELFKYCVNEFKAADIVIGNFETVVHEPKDKSIKETQMCCSRKTLSDLKDVGFSILSLANNHCMQHGVEGFKNTVETCEKDNIHPIGVMDESPYLVDINGMKLAFIALCIHLEWYEPDHILYENSIERILNIVQKLRADDKDVVIILSVHWGDEFATHPSNAQIKLAHRLVDNGADIVLGHHPHVYQGIEEYNGAVVVYSQGNFISDMVPVICRQTGIIKLKIYGRKKIKFTWEPYIIREDLIPVSDESDWLKDRQNELENALIGKYTDNDYWKMIAKNHSAGHNAFKSYFKKNIKKYKLSISSKMIFDFLGRKVKRITGTSTDGRVSSMDMSIYECLDKFK